jgi:hypothetical protein
MAETDGKILVEIVLDDGSVQKGFVKIRDEAKKTGTSIGDSLSSGLSSGFTSLVARAGAVGTAIGAALFSKASIEAAAQQEAAVQRLNQALASAGRFSQEASKQFQDFANEIQRTTVIEDDAVLSLVALSSNFAKTNEEAKKLTEAAIQLSAATGKDLSSSVDLLGKTLSGNLGLIGRSVPALQGLTAEQLKAGAALDTIIARFGGAAQSQINTFSGAVAQLKNSFGDLQEEVGSFITQDKTFVALIKGIADGFAQASKGLSDVRASAGDARSVFGELLILLVKFAEGVNKFLIAPLELVFNFLKTGALAVLTTWNGLFAAIFAGLNKLASFLPDISAFTGLKEALTSESEDLTAKVSANFDALSNAADNALNVNFAGSTALFLEDLRTKMEDAKAITQDFKNNSTNNFKQAAQGIKISIDQIKSVVASGLSSTAQEIGKALQSGQNLFDAFGKGIVGIVGDILITVGNALILQGLAIEKFIASINSLIPGSGALAAAAGFGLVIFGSALKASVGAGGGASAPAGGAGAVPGVTTPIAETPATELTPTSETLREAQTQVVVNVQGDILDSDETGSRIISLINEVYDKKGVQIRRGVTA